MLRANRQGRDLRWGAGGHEGSENRWSGCWEPADRQNSLTPRSGPRGTAGEVSQAGNIDVVIGIHVLSLGSRLVAEAYIFTVDLQRWDMGPGNFRYLRRGGAYPRRGGGCGRSGVWGRCRPSTSRVHPAGPPRTGAVDIARGARPPAHARPPGQGRLGGVQRAHPRGQSADPPGESFPSLNDPFHQQPQKRQEYETQDGGDQDEDTLVFHPRHSAGASVGGSLSVKPGLVVVAGRLEPEQPLLS